MMRIEGFLMRIEGLFALHRRRDGGQRFPTTVTLRGIGKSYDRTEQFDLLAVNIYGLPFQDYPTCRLSSTREFCSDFYFCAERPRMPTFEALLRDLFE